MMPKLKRVGEKNKLRYWSIRNGDSRGFAFLRYKYQDEVLQAMKKSLMVTLAYFIFCNIILMKVNAPSSHKGRMLEPVAKTKARSRIRSPCLRICGGKIREWKLSRPSQALESAIFMISDWNCSWCTTNVYLESFIALVTKFSRVFHDLVIKGTFLCSKKFFKIVSTICKFLYVDI
ncbi:hypothetical protein M9H77_06832 [Catharanthus roseus]|uniref:Uncharacterized protein n=1 Tax=Catharanthus roseus TaxID=4058 RepID=A0ACC0BTI0_CATRO|nr:hypothetical protein M9H77_06832 [Catharanthus roseus]